MQKIIIQCFNGKGSSNHNFILNKQIHAYLRTWTERIVQDGDAAMRL